MHALLSISAYFFNGKISTRIYLIFNFPRSTRYQYHLLKHSTNPLQTSPISEEEEEEEKNPSLTLFLGFHFAIAFSPRYSIRSLVSLCSLFLLDNVVIILSLSLSLSLSRVLGFSPIFILTFFPAWCRSCSVWFTLNFLENETMLRFMDFSPNWIFVISFTALYNYQECSLEMLKQHLCSQMLDP